MVKLKAPMLSQEAHGQLGNVIVFAQRNGRTYARFLTHPADPQSDSQLSYRALIAFLNVEWPKLSVADQQTWTAPALSAGQTPRNTFNGSNTSDWNAEHGPSQTSAPPGKPDTIWAPLLSAQAHVKRIRLLITYSDFSPSWGFSISRSLTSGFTPSSLNTIALVAKTPSPQAYFDYPLISGVPYYYKVRGFSVDGYFGPWTSEATATPL